VLSAATLQVCTTSIPQLLSFLQQADVGTYLQTFNGSGLAAVIKPHDQDIDLWCEQPAMSVAAVQHTEVLASLTEATSHLLATQTQKVE
jgi:hypothetical protein